MWPFTRPFIRSFNKNDLSAMHPKLRPDAIVLQREINTVYSELMRHKKDRKRQKTAEPATRQKSIEVSGTASFGLGVPYHPASGGVDVHVGRTVLVPRR